MSRKGAETQRDAHWFTLTRWVNACLLVSISSLRLCATSALPIAGFRPIRLFDNAPGTEGPFCRPWRDLVRFPIR